ncbi:MAG: hypothetical protein HYS34_10295 [Acidobacteria bacterium]|nr:hypothetical protein [Acidobacteriota bacterium]
MRIPDETGRRPLGEELAFICLRLDAGEAEILGKALRRGVFEIYKAVVLHELAMGRLERAEASRMLGRLVVERARIGPPAGIPGAARKTDRARRPARRRTGR